MIRATVWPCLGLWAMGMLTLEAFAGIKTHPVTFQELLDIRRVPWRGLQLSPDGLSIAVIQKSDRDETGMIQLVPVKENSHPTTAFEGTSPSWSPDSKHLAYLAPAPDEQAQQIWLFDHRTGEKRQLTHRAGGIRPDSPIRDERARLSWSADGSRIAFTALVSEQTAPPLRRATLQTPGEPIVYDSQVYREQVWRDLENMGNDAKSSLADRLSDRQWAHLFIVAVADGSVSQLTHGQVNYGTPEWAPDSKYLASATYDKPDVASSRTSQISLVEARSGQSRPLTSGTAAKRYPLIVSCYPFPAHPGGFQGDTGATSGNQVMAAQGYAVFFPRTLAAQHATFFNRLPQVSQELSGPDGVKVMAEDVLASVDEVIRLGVADPERIGLAGFSNGGAPVHYLVTLTDRFKAAVAVAGVGINTLQQALRWPEWTTGWTGIPNVVYEEPGEYIRWSALFRTQYVHTPMLLAVGEKDAPSTESYAQYYVALRHYGLDATLLIYPNQGHELDVPSRTDFYRRQMAFFDKHLRPRL